MEGYDGFPKIQRKKKMKKKKEIHEPVPSQGEETNMTLRELLYSL
jgi:hypothetical protein